MSGTGTSPSEHEPLLAAAINDDDEGKRALGTDKADEVAPQLSLSALIGVSMPYMALNLILTMINTWLTYFWLPPEESNKIDYFGFAGGTFLGRLVDGLWGVQIGFLSDRLRSSMGRRRPFILIGAPLWAIAFAMLFMSPTPTASTANTVYFVCMFILFSLALGTVATPYTALIPEITTTSAQRLRLTSMGGVFSILGHILSAAIGPLVYYFQDAFPSGLQIGAITVQSGLQLWAIFAALSLVTYITAAMIVKERPPTDPSTVSIKQLWMDTLHVSTNPLFITLALSTNVLSPCAYFLLSADLPYLFSAVYEQEDGIIKPGTGNLWLGMAILITVIGSLVGVPLISAIARRIGKKRVLVLANVIVSVAMFIIFSSHWMHDPAILAMCATVLVSVPSTAFFTLPNAVYADVVDHEYAKSGQRREGVYAGAARLWNRISMALAMLVFTWMLDLGKTPENNTGVVYITLISSCLFMISGIVMAFHAVDK